MKSRKQNCTFFSDGSRVGYGVVAYLRLVDIYDRIHRSFVLGRARVAPIREITIPRLELSAAVVSVQLRETIQRELDMRLDRVTFWCDSLYVLKCIRNEKKRSIRSSQIALPLFIMDRTSQSGGYGECY